MENMNMYKFLGMMALEFRLSLDNICKILGKKPTEEIKMEIYRKIEMTANKNESIINSYKYLFFYETINEPINMSIIAQARAVNYLKRHRKAVKENDKDKLKELEDELYKTDRQFKEISDKIALEKLDESYIEKILRYRLKYAIPRNVFCRSYNLRRNTLSDREKKISSNYLQQKLERLSDYHYSLSRNNNSSNHKK